MNERKIPNKTQDRFDSLSAQRAYLRYRWYKALKWLKLL